MRSRLNLEQLIIFVPGDGGRRDAVGFAVERNWVEPRHHHVQRVLRYSRRIQTCNETNKSQMK